jgi:membrane-associated phospholipid phosphatase
LIIAGIALSGNSPGGVKQWIVKERDKLLPNFRVRVDDYLQFSPIAIAYGLDALGIKSRNDFQNRTAILLKGELVMLATTRLLKDVTRVRRPSGAGHSSFPSGHTAQAFAAAVFLSEEYKRNLPWVPYLSYGIASSVGLLRLANNKHYIDDVLVGAGMGYLSMKLSYWTHRHKWNKKRAHRPSRAKSGW